MVVKTEEFEKKLQLLLSKYKDAIESKDGAFINEYIKECLDRDVVISPRSFKVNSQRRPKNLIKKVILLFFFFIGLLLYAREEFSNKSPSGEDGYSEDANYWTYFIRRWAIRFGLNKLVPIKKLYDTDCLMENPFLPKPDRPCHCGFTIKNYDLKNQTVLSQKAFLNKLKSSNTNPFIMKNLMEYPVSYIDLRNLVMGALKDFESGHSFTTSLAGKDVSSDYKQLFADESGPPAYSTVAWDLNFVTVAHHLRKLFPRPFFVGPDLEIFLARRLILYGEKAPKRPPTKISEEKAGSFYIQAWGSRVMALKSSPQCGCKSSAVAFRLNQGDLLYFNGDYHDLFSAPAEQEVHSLGYIGYVNNAVAQQM